jgi:hypothetical protein
MFSAKQVLGQKKQFYITETDRVLSTLRAEAEETVELRA